MMAGSPKVVAKATAAELAERVCGLMRSQVPELKGLVIGAAAAPADPLLKALVGIFSRLAEIVVDRINQVPDKNLLAFLDMIGACPMPPRAARVPLTFSLGAGYDGDALVPPRTQVAAPATASVPTAIVFETERELVVSAAKMVSVFVRDPVQDTEADLGAITGAALEPGLPAFQGNRAIEHDLYLRSDILLAYPDIQQLGVTFAVANCSATDLRTMVWEVWDGFSGISLTPSADGSANLTKTGEVIFDRPPPVPLQSVQGRSGRWLRARLKTAISQSVDARAGMVRANSLPTLSGATLRILVERKNLRPAAAFSDTTELDLSKDFYPFGQQPRFGNCFYISCDDALALAGVTLTVNIDLTNPVGGSGPIKAVTPGVSLQWEFWNGLTWVCLLRADDKTGAPAGVGSLSSSGQLILTLPDQTAAIAVNGRSAYWLRVRIVGGNYGSDARYDPVTVNNVTMYSLVPANYSPPSIARISLDCRLARSAVADSIAINNDSCWQIVAGSPFAPFRPTHDEGPGLYFGFDRQPPNKPISLYFGVEKLTYGQRRIPVDPAASTVAADAGATASHRVTLTNPSGQAVTVKLALRGSRWTSRLAASNESVSLAAGSSAELEVQVTVPANALTGASDIANLLCEFSSTPGIWFQALLETCCGAALQAPPTRLAWEYWNGSQWLTLTVRDDSQGLNQAALIEILVPADSTARAEFGLQRHWLRLRRRQGPASFVPRLSRVIPNTTMASQAVTVLNELIGSSNGAAGQKFKTVAAPVLAGERIEIREFDMPSAGDLETIAAAVGEDAVRIVADAAGRPLEIWARWLAVSDFHASGPRDRHVVLDRLSGQLIFGDGQQGMIPRSASGNIRMANYTSGGGVAGNLPAGRLIQLKAAIPYIDKVVNLEPATGGAAAESLDHLVVRAPRAVRHRDRAVTMEDFEDLARLADPGVARAKCVPLADLLNHPLADDQARLGAVGLIVVPVSLEARPSPSLELLDRVRTYIERRMPVTARLSVVGPLYVTVTVKVEIGLTSLEGSEALRAVIAAALADYLHPLLGGPLRTGWEFGRQPHAADLYVLLEAIAGVDHVRSLVVAESCDSGLDLVEVKASGRFLVNSGRHSVALVLSGQSAVTQGN